MENQPRFSNQQWDKLCEETFAQIRALAKSKGGEYSGDEDRLANFRKNGASLGLLMETVWGVYAGKHWDAIQTYIKDSQQGRARTRSEPIEGRVDDLLVYLLLFKAMLLEHNAFAGWKIVESPAMMQAYCTDNSHYKYAAIAALCPVCQGIRK